MINIDTQVSDASEGGPIRGPVIYTLKFPVTLRDTKGAVVQELTELTLNRMAGGAAKQVLNAYQRGAGDFSVALVAAAARLPPSAVEQLDAEDLMDATVAATPFLGKFQPT